MELGGKDPAYVRADCELTQALENLVGMYTFGVLTEETKLTCSCYSPSLLIHVSMRSDVKDCHLIHRPMTLNLLSCLPLQMARSSTAGNVAAQSSAFMYMIASMKNLLSASSNLQRFCLVHVEVPVALFLQGKPPDLPHCI